MMDFPFLSGGAGAVAELPLFTMYAWDFNKNEFIRDGNGKLILLEGDAALAVWCQKCILTERFHYLAYSTRYGSEVYDAIGKVMSYGERKSEFRRMLTEALLVNSYIKSVDKVEFEPLNHETDWTVHITLTTIYGKVEI